ncbi:MAG: amidase [Rhodospirillaceae bacterium]|nr:amidase [Rhodospirillaceae bacterium]MBT4425523.1 amidase [Rhodospirillaceae bacterium]MBT5038328.1 amidase [Rhodospirillaceae bacterium]MBT5675272.1 amidase [Rhodospirillaceae bacterium]
MSAEILNASLVDTAEAIRTKKLSSVEVVRASIARAEALQPVLNCFTQLLAEEALEEAEKCDAELARGELRGPLHGVPMAHKDMYYRAGKRTTCGSKIRKDYIADSDSTALKRLLDAGSIYLGGLNMAEFATGPTGHNAHWGDNHNPWNPDHIAGGSSSGTGSSVAARIHYGGLGSDTGGSIRIPSSVNGLVGMKTTNGLVSRHGLMPLSFTMDTVGALTRTVRDNACLTAIMAGQDPLDATTSSRPVPDYEATLGQSIKGLRIGVPANYYYEVTTPEIKELQDASIAVFRDLGAEIIEIEVPDMHVPTHMSNIVFPAEAATIHGTWLRERPEDYQDQVRSRYEIGLYIPAAKYLSALGARVNLLREFSDMVFSKVDVLHTPGLSIAVPSLADTDVAAGQGMPEMVARLSWTTRSNNYLGIPALAVPCGFTADGLPSGFQLMGRPFSEAQLFQLGHAYQGATDWHERVPDIST